ncbi:MAG: serine/threonine protein kinase [Phycisphaeraceae bacterium]|nr:serine/threonine protein kinase [Phycisphaeraceae bacterium]
MAGSSTTSSISSGSVGAAGDPRPSKGDSYIRAVRAGVFEHDPEFRDRSRFLPPLFPGDVSGHASHAESTSSAPLDYVFASTGQPSLPQDVFNRLRWGGQFVFVSRSEQEVVELATKYRDRRGFIVEREPASMRMRFLGLPIPGLGKVLHYFAARKILLIQPGQTTERFTYDVRLVKCPPPRTGYAVLKQIPELDNVIGRLRERLPEASMDTIVKGARKLVEKIFPVFLTREAAFLSILRRDLPAPYNARVPQIIDLQKDSNGFVRKLYLEWLRNGSAPLTQLEFARQSAELLSVLHDQARVIHLDLRLDNFVITPRGVGFIDFGSAVRVDENLSENPMLRTLFDEMMTTSQIQRDLGKMMRRGKVTSRMIVDSHQKVDKGVDIFYLALQMNDPHSNPDFEGLVAYRPDSREAKALAALTAEVLKPDDPEHPPFASAKDMVAAIEKIERKLANSST